MPPAGPPEPVRRAAQQPSGAKTRGYRPGAPDSREAAQVNGKLVAGDIRGAMECSRKARMWCWIGLGVGLVGVLAYVAMIALSVLLER